MSLNPARGSPLAGVSVREVMVPCSTFVEPRDPVTRARAIMREEGLRTIPVVAGGRLEGLLTSRDVMRVTSTKSNIPVSGLMLPPQPLITPADPAGRACLEMIGAGLREVPVVQSRTDRTVVGILRLDAVLGVIAARMGKEAKVEDIMTRDVISCDPEDELSRVWDMMEDGRISGVPVVRREGRRTVVVGMITRSDLIRSGAIRLGQESDKGRFRTPPRVKSAMRTPVVTVTPDTPVARAAEIMIERRIGRLPVISGGELVGIVSVSDVIRAMGG
jgi:CBS domain-containing protein